jgi:UDPglucose 6-dehydrogenase
MKIGIIGMGKLGIPTAVTFAYKGHDIIGLDVRDIDLSKFDAIETGPDGKEPFKPYLDEVAGNKFKICRHIFNFVKEAPEIIFVAVQTPHNEIFSGEIRTPKEKENFDYSHLAIALAILNEWITTPTIVSIISTVLPQTIRPIIESLSKTNANLKFCYTPFFVSMGNVMKDLLNPEFNLLGTYDDEATVKITDFFKSINDAQVMKMSIESAELCKVYYNCYIGMKILFCNTLGEMCHKIPGCDVNDITDAICKANQRLISTRYLTPSIGDGGACHCRDQVAMSWLASKLNLSYNIFDSIIEARERQAGWFVSLIEPFYKKGFKVVILGQSFKPESAITTGSHAVLIKNFLLEKGIEVKIYDPLLDKEPIKLTDNTVYFIATKHKCFEDIDFPQGSVIIDPHRYIKEKSGITVISVGIGK